MNDYLKDKLKPSITNWTAISKKISYEPILQDSLNVQYESKGSILKIIGNFSIENADNYMNLTPKEFYVKNIIFKSNGKSIDFNYDVISCSFDFLEKSFEVVCFIESDHPSFLNQHNISDAFTTNEIDIRIIFNFRGYSNLEYYELEMLEANNSLKVGYLGEAFIHSRIAFESWLRHETKDEYDLNWKNAFNNYYYKDVKSNPKPDIKTEDKDLYNKLNKLGMIRNKLVHGNRQSLKILKLLKPVDIINQIKLINAKNDEMQYLLDYWDVKSNLSKKDINNL